MTNKAWARVARFSRDIRGNFTMTFAIAAPCLLLGVAAAVTYANSVSSNQKLQAAADSAALAATTALTNGQTTTQAQTVATNLFASNAPGYDGSVVPTVSASVSNNNATATISYQAPALNTPLSSLLGGAPAPHVSATAVGPISYASSKTTFAGTGGIYGDPHLNGALGGSNIFQCQTNNAWYNALSDAGIEVNFSCY